MFIIGELINGMYKKVAEALLEKDATYIRALAGAQVEVGAQALDVNCGPMSRDIVGDLRWLVENIQKEVDVPLCLDSTKIQAIEEGLKGARVKCIINSSSADKEKLDLYIPLAKKYQASLIVLTMDKKGVPGNKDRRLELAAQIIEAAYAYEFPVQDLYLDPILLPVNVAQNQLFDILESVKDFKSMTTPSVKTVVGLSNISQGSKERSLINRTFLVMAQSYGLDAAILDPLDGELMNSLITADLVLNKTIYCGSYLEAYKKSKIK